VAALTSLLAAASVSAIAGCGTDAPASARSSTAARTAGNLTVLAAASLTESFTQLGKDFEATHPGTTITFSFGSSAALATQINAGAPADVFAAASDATMRMVTETGHANQPVPFASNTLEIAVPQGNPGNVTGLHDFADAGLRIALCANQVPCGAAAAKVFELAGIAPQPDTLETDVKATLQKVRLGEVDAALVYRTDVIAAGEEVEGIEFAEAAQAANSYPITALQPSKDPELTQSFVDHVLSPSGQAVLRKAGFDQP
jgi:molybdate transport system substrate-binding protein